MTKFAVLLRQLRTARGMTQEELAERAGISSRAVSDLERSVNRTARRDTTRLLASALQLSDSQRRFFEQAAIGRPAILPPTSSGRRLPLPPTPLAGRRLELNDAGALLLREDVRLVTLTGPAGVGKTRLALGVAQEAADAFVDGVEFVDLTSLRDPALVIPTIAHAFGLREGERSPPDVLAEHLNEWAGLLILDNFEQVVDAAGMLARIIGLARRLTVLATSRRSLRIAAEHEFPVSPFELPSPRDREVGELMTHPAVEIFALRAAAARPGWHLDEDNVPVVAELCARLDGLPLALELAAARTRLLDPADLLARMTDRLPLLTLGTRDAPHRHQTLRAALDWSYQLLDSRSQTTFRQLAVFSGGWTLDAAAVVCTSTESDTMEGLTALLESSLIRNIDAPDPARLTMLATIREYSAARLDSREENLIARRHLNWAIQLAEHADTGLLGPDQGRWLAILTAEDGNLRTALSHAMTIHDTVGAQRLAGALWRYWEITGRVSEGRHWLGRALALGEDTPVQVRATATKAAGNLARDQGDETSARQLYTAALNLFQAVRDPIGVSSTYCNLGNIALDAGDPAEAIRRYEMSLASAQAANNHPLTALVLNNLGLALRRDGDLQYATTVVTQSLTLWQEIGNLREIARAHDTQGRILCARGEFAAALPSLRQSLGLRQQIGDRAGTARSLEALARAMVGVGEHRSAARFLGYAEDLRAHIKEPLTIDDRFEYDPTVQALTDALSAKALTAEWLAGSALDLTNLIEEIEPG